MHTKIYKMHTKMQYVHIMYTALESKCSVTKTYARRVLNSPPVSYEMLFSLCTKRFAVKDCSRCKGVLRLCVKTGQMSQRVNQRCRQAKVCLCRLPKR